MLRNDFWIGTMAAQGMLDPFIPSLVRQLPQGGGAISYGLSSFGYDLRLSPKQFLVMRRQPGQVVDPKAFDAGNLEPAQLQQDEKGSFFVLPGHSYGLGVTVERLQIPDEVTCLFIGKSTYARCGIIANLTPGEAGWRGHLTLEISNASPADCRIYANEGICQALFFQGEPCGTSYRERNGKYQDQLEEVVTARL